MGDGFIAIQLAVLIAVSIVWNTSRQCRSTIACVRLNWEVVSRETVVGSATGMENSFPDCAIGLGSARRDSNEADLISSAANFRVRSTELMNLALSILNVRRRGLLSPHNLHP